MLECENVSRTKMVKDPSVVKISLWPALPVPKEIGKMQFVQSFSTRELVVNMVLIRNNVTKESTYGWYPSQVDVYENPRAKHGYDKECLFNFWRSGLIYPNAPTAGGALTPPSLSAYRPRTKSGASRSSAKRRPTLRYNAPETSLSVQGINALSLGNEEDMTGVRAAPLISRSRLDHRIPTPNVSRGHHGWQPQPTIIGVIDPNQPFIAPSPALDNNDQVEQRVLTPAERISRGSRVQSARLHRPKMTSSRSIKSAGIACKITNDTSSVSLNIDTEDGDKKKPSRSYLNQLQYELHSPVDEEVEEIERPPTPVNLRTPTPIDANSPTYEEQVNKYGWIAEVHGDPLNLKVLTERLPYTVQCDDPVVQDDPYKTKVIAGETFFYNTIPRHMMTFTVHPEWQSEHFVAKRKELEKQGQKFHTRNFGFVY